LVRKYSWQKRLIELWSWLKRWQSVIMAVQLELNVLPVVQEQLTAEAVG